MRQALHVGLGDPCPWYIPLPDSLKSTVTPISTAVIKIEILVYKLIKAVIY